MSDLDIRTKMVAGDPIEVGERRLSPSILLTTVRTNTGEQGGFLAARARPVSIVEKGPERNRWHAIPNTTQETLSVMAAVGIGVALISSVLILVIKLIRR
jgi:hypothetical protein